MHVKVANPDHVVRDPQTRQFIPAEGLSVPDDSPFYQRLIADGSVIVMPPDEVASAD